MIDVYEGTLGSMFNIEKVAVEINTALININDDLSYEVISNDIEPILITGSHVAEKDIPFFEHPFIFNKVDQTQAIALDLRPFMKNKLDNLLTVTDKLQDKYNGILQIRRLIINKLLLENNMDWYGSIKTNLMEAYASYLSTIISMLTFDKSNKEIVSILAKLQFVTLNEPELEVTKLRDVIDRLPRKDIGMLLSGPLKEEYTILESLFKSGEITFPSVSIGNFISNVKAVLPGTRGNGLTTDILIQAMSRTFYSVNSNYMAIALVEHLPTFISIFISVVDETINSKSSFRKIINDEKSRIKPKETVKFLKSVIEDELV